MSERSAAIKCSTCEVHAESTFKIDGMDCREEVVILERRLRHLPGLEDLAADLVGQRLRVRYDAAKLSASTIREAVAQTGMRAWLEHEHSTAALSSAAKWRQGWVAVSGAALAIGLALQWADVSAGFVRIAFVIALVTGGIHTARRAWSAARMLSLDINVLMLVAVIGAMAIGQWSEAATVVFLFALAQLLEARSLEGARNAIRALMDLAPAEALLHADGAERRVRVDEVRVGDIVVVRPGEKIPLDGEVIAGESPVNQAPITGESLPVDKQPGDEVYAGTINGRGALETRVTHLRRDTALARIIALVELAQAQRAPTQLLVERFARYYTPAVIALAIAVALVLPPLLGQPFSTWVYRALVLLVISCPCALVISTPISVVSAIAGAARKGVLVKGGIHLERTGTVRCVAFDKTGTLTKGIPQVVNVVPLNGVSPAEILRIAATLESRSEHPIGRAIVAHALSEGMNVKSGDGLQSLPGRGAEGLVDGEATLVGNHRLFEERGLCTPAIHSRLETLGRQGRTAVLVARRGQMIGVIELADGRRESGRDAVELLRRQGIAHVVMLTGDNQATADAIARGLGIDEVRAELLPEDKVVAVEQLRRAYGPVAMVGDGVNDAPALAAADVGIAMGAAGTDVALETADVALMADELLKIPYTIRLGRATLRNIKVNVSIALSLKALFLAMAVVGASTLWMAVLADTGASLIVIANGLRLLNAD